MLGYGPSDDEGGGRRAELAALCQPVKIPGGPGLSPDLHAEVRATAVRRSSDRAVGRLFGGAGRDGGLDEREGQERGSDRH